MIKSVIISISNSTVYLLYFVQYIVNEADSTIFLFLIILTCLCGAHYLEFKVLSLPRQSAATLARFIGIFKAYSTSCV